MTASELLNHLWSDYTRLAPQARDIVARIERRGERVVNDHVALRTINLPGADIADVAAPFLAAGWTWADDDYHFPAKKLRARYLRAPETDMPRVFISALQLQEMPPAVAELLRSIVDPAIAGGLVVPGRPWTVGHAQYEALRRVSEYAAWFAACGWRVNHFTVSVNHLTGFADFAAFMRWVESEGFPLNDHGGLIKGSAAVGLEQGSTMAPTVPITLADGTWELPGCYVEFALRHPVNGTLFDGFLPESADKIFESTDKS